MFNIEVFQNFVFIFFFSERTLKDLRQDYPERTQPLIWDHITINDPRLYDTACALREDHGTAHTSVLAPDGSAVSVTSTINHV